MVLIQSVHRGGLRGWGAEGSEPALEESGVGAQPPLLGYGLPHFRPTSRGGIQPQTPKIFLGGCVPQTPLPFRLGLRPPDPPGILT